MKQNVIKITTEIIKELVKKKSQTGKAQEQMECRVTGRRN